MKSLIKHLEDTLVIMKGNKSVVKRTQESINALQSIRGTGKESIFLALANVNLMKERLDSVNHISRELNCNLFNLPEFFENIEELEIDDRDFFAMEINNSTYKVPINQMDRESIDNTFNLLLMSLMRSLSTLNTAIIDNAKEVKQSFFLEIKEGNAPVTDRLFDTLSGVINSKEEVDDINKTFIYNLIEKIDLCPEDDTPLLKKEDVMYLSPFALMFLTGLEVRKVDKNLPFMLLAKFAEIEDSISPNEAHLLINRITEISALLDNPVFENDNINLNKFNDSPKYPGLFRSIYLEEMANEGRDAVLDEDALKMLKSAMILDNLRAKLIDIINEQGGVIGKATELKDKNEEFLKEVVDSAFKDISNEFSFLGSLSKMV